MSDAALARLALGLKLDGFRLRHTAGGPIFRGTVEAHGVAVGLRLEYERTYTEPPRVIVETPERLPKGVVAHLDEVNDLCVVDRTAYVADRYRLAEQGRGIVRRAKEILARAGTRAAAAEIAEEFPRHWGGKVIYVNFAPSDGYARPVADRTYMEFELCAKPVKTPNLGAAVVATEVRLSFRPGQGRPNTLGEALAWAADFDASLPQRLLARLGAIGPADPYAIIHAPNGVVGLQLRVSALGPARQRSILQPKTWQRLLNGRFGRELVIERTQGRRVDTEYILGSNGAGGVAPLTGRSIVLVGCGAIGGFLSAGLAQLGAGLGGGHLLLIDHDELSARNTARHRLGAGFVGRNKALGCRQSLGADLPRLSVSALPLKVEQCRAQILASALVIDASGEQGVGDLLNAWRLEAVAVGAAPDLLHVWIEGAGAAARTHFSSDPAFGCYRCLQPDLAQPRFPALKPNVSPEMTTGCGEAPFSPYGPAAPMCAAGLAATHVLDWAAGHPRPLMRTQRLNLADTVERPPTNPTRSEACPACGGR